MGVQDQVIKTIILCNLGGDLDGTLVAEASAELDVVEGDEVVRWLSPDEAPVSIVKPKDTDNWLGSLLQN